MTYKFLYWQENEMTDEQSPDDTDDMDAILEEDDDDLDDEGDEPDAEIEDEVEESK